MSREPQHSHPGTYRRVSVDANRKCPALRGPARRGQIIGTKGTPQAERPRAATIIRNMSAGFMRTVLACAPAVCPGSLRRSLAAPGLRCKATRQRRLPRRHGPAPARARVVKDISLAESLRPAPGWPPLHERRQARRIAPNWPDQRRKTGAALLRCRARIPLTQGDPSRLDTSYS